MGDGGGSGSLFLGKTAPGPAPALVAGGDLAPGYVVGEYRVERVIGRGGMGVVYSGLQPLIEKRVAIKVLNLQLSSDPALVRRFLDEGRAVNRIRHPNIIDIFSFGQLADGRQYFVMEYLEGRTLAERLEAGDLPSTDLAPLLGQVCDALDAAHGEHIVHRDLKPENVWIVEPKRGRPFAKLLDFGIAKLLGASDPATTQAGMLIGTPYYMSPEQCEGKAIDHRTDIYAMGVILYLIYTGKHPLEGEAFTEILVKQLNQVPARPSTLVAMPEALDALIMRCLAKDPAGRPPSARAVGEELAAILAAPRPASPLARIVSPTTTLQGSAHAAEGIPATVPRSRRWMRLAALALAGGASVLAAVILTGGHREGQPASTSVAPSFSAAAPVPPVPPVPAQFPDAAPMAATALPAPLVPAGEAAPGHPEPKRRVSSAKTGRRETPSPATRARSSHLITDNPFR